MTEREFLRRQELLARERFVRAADGAKASFEDAFDLQTHVREHPFASLAVGAGAGIAIGNLLSKRPGSWMRPVLVPAAKIVLAALGRSLVVDFLLGEPGA